MKYHYSKDSLNKLYTCEFDIRTVFLEAIKYADIRILCGVRTLDEQKVLFDSGRSKTLKSNHLPNENDLSEAIDAVVLPLDWNDREQFALFSGFIVGLSCALKSQGVVKRRLISGIDWDADFNIKEHSFFDGPHFELEKL